jgi:hypothetical protein
MRQVWVVAHSFSRGKASDDTVTAMVFNTNARKMFVPRVELSKDGDDFVTTRKTLANAKSTIQKQSSSGRLP